MGLFYYIYFDLCPRKGEEKGYFSIQIVPPTPEID